MQQRGIALGGPLAAPTGLPAPRAGDRVSGCKFTQAPLNGRRRDPRRTRHLRDAAVADRLGFCGRPHPARSLGQDGRQSRMLGSQRGQIHRANVPPVDQEYKLLFPDRPYLPTICGDPSGVMQVGLVRFHGEPSSNKRL
jgi:hypothetical protein